MDDGDTYNFADVSYTASMANTPGEWYTISFQLHESDDLYVSDDDHSPIASINYYQTSNWGIGGTRYIYAGGADGPRGYMYFKVESVD